ncbi:MAG: CHAT domain-containing tetratricopeptide repeat protein [Bacteroidota bacterium]
MSRLILFTLFLFITQCALSQSWKSLNQKGVSLYQRGDFDKALEVNEKALEKAKNSYGTISDKYISSLNNLAYCYQAKGDYPKATSKFRRSTNLTQKLYNTIEHVEYVRTLNNLVNIYLSTAQFDSCEHYILVARNVFLNTYNNRRAHFDENIYAFYETLLSIQNSQASLYYNRGQVLEAIEVLEKEVASLKQDVKDNYISSSSYNVMISNLSTYYLEVGKNALAKSLIEEYLSVTVPSKKDPFSYLYAIQNLGSLYSKTNKPDSAQMTWLRALDFIKKYELEGHRLHTIILNNLGELYLSLENYKEAEKNLVLSRQLQEQRISVSPALYKTTIFNLAETYRWSGDYKQADKLYRLLISRIKEDITRNFTYLSDQEKRAFYLSQVSYVENFTSFALEISGVLGFEDIEKDELRPDVTRDLYDLQLMLKASILNSSYKMKNRIISSDNELLKNGYRKWETRKNYLAGLYESGTSSKQDILFQEQEIENLEKSLILLSSEFKEGFIPERISWKEIQSILQPGEAAVEIIRMVDGLVYGALIVTPETRERPLMTMIMSTRSKHLERQYYNQYKNSINYKVTDTTSYGVYFKPILETINSNLPGAENLKKIYFSPDGIYNQINLNTLYDPKEAEYVLDKVEIVQVTNTKELIQRRNVNPFSNGNIPTAMLFGRPSFSLDTISTETPIFTDLEGTGIEVHRIREQLSSGNWHIKSHTGVEANEAVLKKISSPQVLHVATHGFFQNEETDNTLIKVLLNSGIALTGANDNEGYQGENGILTAFEALNLSLDSTELVVLSACETGLGKVHPGEGVYGLQKALKSAGAKSIIMSLWKVDDKATQELMVQFYDYWIASSQKREAFRKAQIELREKYPHPYYWGAFVITGI